VAQAAREQQQRERELMQSRLHAQEMERQRTEAQENFIRAEAQRLAGESIRLTITGGNAELAALLAIASITMTYTAQGDEALMHALKLDLPRFRLIGHDHDWVHALALSHDGRLALSGGNDGLAIIWDTATGTAIHTLRGHPEQIFAVAFSPDGTLIASGDRYGDVVVWDTASGRQISSFASGSVGVRSLRFTTDTTCLYVAGEANPAAVWRWNLATLQRERVLTLHNDTLLYADLSPDEDLLVVAGRGRVVRIYHAHTSELLRELHGHTDWIWGA
jgi:WD40 repeat protein